jgi:23S rRNA (uracil1939-C5)-methyltransferase
LRIYLQPGGVDSLQLLFPESFDQPLHYHLRAFDIRIDFAPLDFVQVNDAINQRMVEFSVQQLRPGTDDRVLDLFCGIGNFSLPLARLAGSVLGVEGEQSLVDKARENAAGNDLVNVEFRRADLNKINGSEPWIVAGCDRVLLDPARSGAIEVVERMNLLDPARIVYVSCHPGTLARDTAILVHKKGYTLESAGIIDMFPHTAHVESIAVFRKS